MSDYAQMMEGRKRAEETLDLVRDHVRAGLSMAGDELHTHLWALAGKLGLVEPDEAASAEREVLEPEAEPPPPPPGEPPAEIVTGGDHHDEAPAETADEIGETKGSA